jgi:hypothetical protein
MKIARLVSTSLLVAGMAVVCPSSHAVSLASILHLHSHLTTTSTPKAEVGPLAELQIKNLNVDFRDLKVGNRVYTVFPKHTMVITAPVGTPVYAASSMFHKHAKGSLVTQVESGSHTLTVD